MRKGDNVKELSGGLQIVRNLAYKANTTFQWYKGASVADHTEQDEFTQAAYDWAFAREGIMITEEDMFKNRGDKHRIFSLLDERRENAEMSMQDNISQAVHGGLSGPAGAQFNGLTTLIPDAAGTVGGIDASAEAWWDVKRVATATAANLKEKIAELYGDVVVKVPAGMRTGLVGITTRAIFRELEDQLETHGRFTMSDNDPTSISFGLESIHYNGRPIIWDDDAVASRFKFVNTNYLKLYVAPDRNFTTTETASPFDAEFMVSYIRFAGNLVSNFQAAQGTIASVTV
jgi:hypothetical protein